MLEIMLCGAHDAQTVSQSFTKVVQNFGATPWFYQDGRIKHINSATASWAENSRATVSKADICVFVILDKYGDITWNQELEETLEIGKPFIVLALESSWLRYQTLRHTISDPNAIKSEDDKKMVDALRIISEYQFTVISFSYESFEEKLRFALAMLVEEGTSLLQKYNQRKVFIQSLKSEGPLSRRDIEKLIMLACDEYDTDKQSRKNAIRRLAANETRDNEMTIQLCESVEQGVARLAFDLLPSLIEMPLNDDLLRELAEIARRTDDVGVARRLITSVALLDPSKLDLLLESMDGPEEGARRRAYEGVENHWDKVIAEWGPERMKRFLKMCEAKTPMHASWLQRLQNQLAALP